MHASPSRRTGTAPPSSRLGAWAFGEYVRGRRAFVAEFERRAALAESERLALARVAVAEDRARIAREIHDVLAQSVSVMVLNAEGGRLMRPADPTVVDPVTAGPPSPSRPICGGRSAAWTRVAHAPGWTCAESDARVGGNTGTEGPGRLVRVRVENSAGAGGGADPERPAPLLPCGRGLTGMCGCAALCGGRHGRCGAARRADRRRRPPARRPAPAGHRRRGERGTSSRAGPHPPLPPHPSRTGATPEARPRDTERESGQSIVRSAPDYAET
ncbi:histidine kinase dimerization/phosphoacceptor domain-containing protein [Streptomyces sp. NPDC005811]|uniref:histidine kinase dimerization/phosphoacceptor domain-containing protein n=1 Tax=Streptomyces sp. NPDC005811 TaxID=3154565 RepID=UPI0033F38876